MYGANEANLKSMTVLGWIAYATGATIMARMKIMPKHVMAFLMKMKMLVAISVFDTTICTNNIHNAATMIMPMVCNGTSSTIWGRVWLLVVVVGETMDETEHVGVSDVDLELGSTIGDTDLGDTDTGWGAFIEVI